MTDADSDAGVAETRQERAVLFIDAYLEEHKALFDALADE